MSLPNPSMSFSPFDILTADEMNDLVENDQALAAGTGLDNGSITSSKVLDNNITAPKLATNAITLGYAQITSNFSVTSSTPTQVTGLSAAVSIPSGGRRVKVTFQCRDAFRAGGGPFDITLWDGNVVSGTKIQGIQPNTPNGNAQSATLIWVSNVAPSAGAKTYNIGLSSATNQSTIEASSDSPAFILVEVI